jgi:hypothetical protein
MSASESGGRRPGPKGASLRDRAAPDRTSGRPSVRVSEGAVGPSEGANCGSSEGVGARR